MEFIKKNPKIIILSGKAQSGKNETANIIKEYYETKNKKTVILAYASYLKMYAKEITNWDGSEDTKPRDLLQQLGVELIKNKINPNMLINRIIEDIKIYEYFFDTIIISDARFVDEIETIKKNYSNISVIHIIGNKNNLTDAQRNHPTEIGLDNYNKYDYEINNKETKQELKKIIFNLLEEV